LTEGELRATGLYLDRYLAPSCRDYENQVLSAGLSAGFSLVTQQAKVTGIGTVVGLRDHGYQIEHAPVTFRVGWKPTEIHSDQMPLLG
jgi:hypothetical protein